MNLIKRKNNGFTLVELMIVVAIIGIIAGVATSKFGEVLRRSREGTVKANLGMIRSALNIYYADNLAFFPSGAAPTANATTLSSTLVTKYLKEIPYIEVYPYHAKTNSVDNVPDTNYSNHDPTSDGEWVYVSDSTDQEWGWIAVESYFTDTSGKYWTSY